VLKKPYGYVYFILLLVLSASPRAEDSAETLIQTGQTQAAQGQFDAALASFEQAIALEPRSSLAYTRMGGVQVLRQQYRLGIDAFKQAIMLDQRNADAFVGMAVAYLHLGDESLARAALHEAETLNPAKKPEIAKVLALLDQKSSGKPSTH
jgi:tetratricopeptide (TPR) repeat protein